MSNKKLYRSQSNRMLCGVCGGIADYFNIDSTIVRLIFVFLGLSGGTGILFYLIAAVVIPNGMDKKTDHNRGCCKIAEDINTAPLRFCGSPCLLYHPAGAGPVIGLSV